MPSIKCLDSDWMVVKDVFEFYIHSQDQIIAFSCVMIIVCLAKFDHKTASRVIGCLISKAFETQNCVHSITWIYLHLKCLRCPFNSPGIVLHFVDFVYHMLKRTVIKFF